MPGRNLLPLLLAASVASAGLARAALPLPSFPDGQEEVSRGQQAYARGLLAALEDSNDEVVAWALRSLVALPLDGMPEVRQKLLAFLRGPRVTKALSGQEGKLREAALICLGTLGESSPEVAPRLVDLLGTRDLDTRQAVTEALGKLGEAAQGQAPRLVELLKDPRWEVRHAAESALEALYHRLLQDPRHGDLVVLATRTVRERRFSQWSMTYAGRRDDLDLAELQAASGSREVEGMLLEGASAA